MNYLYLILEKRILDGNYFQLVLINLFDVLINAKNHIKLINYSFFRYFNSSKLASKLPLIDILITNYFNIHFKIK